MNLRACDDYCELIPTNSVANLSLLECSWTFLGGH